VKPVTQGALVALLNSDLLSVERLALGRAAVGVSMLARPTLLPRLLGVDSATATRMAWSSQMLGAREVALGLGTWTALRQQNPRAARLWLMAGLLSDGVDALAVGAAAAGGRLNRLAGAGVVAVAGGAVAAQVAALSEARTDA